MKPAGALAILFASVLFALLALRHGREGIRAHYDLQRSLLVLRRELSEHMRPLPEAFRLLCEQKETGEAGTFFQELSAGMESLGEKRFCELWRDAAERRLGFLEREERQQVALLGELLGGGELELSCRQLGETADALGRKAEEKGKKEREKRRAIWGISLSAGAFVILLLL